MDIVAQSGSHALIEAFADLSALTNHDWLHSLLLSSINSRLACISPSAPMRKSIACLYVRGEHVPGTSRIRNLDHARCLRQYGRLLPEWDEQAYESWAMRFQREVLTAMAAEKGNALTQTTVRYLAAWAAFAERTKDCPVMDDGGMTPAAFAMKMLAFNLMRAVPQDHELVRQAIEAGAKQECAAAPIFSRMYRARLAQHILFGSGPGAALSAQKRADVAADTLCADSGDYGRAVLDATAHAITLAHEDVRDALYVEGRSHNQAFAMLAKAGQNIPDPLLRAPGPAA
jgi:hypothetical protein